MASLDTTIDWCEENFVVHPQIAEFWNTVTSVVAIVPPIIWFLQPAPAGSGLIPFMHLLAAVIFVGSTAFHGTLTWTGQLLDEVPILLWTSASFAICLDSYSLSPPRRGVPGLGLGATRAWWSPGPAALGCLCMLQAALVTYFYTTDAKVYAMFLGGVVVQAAAHWPIIIAELRGRLGAPSPYRALVARHVRLGYGGYALWCAENALCTTLRPLRLHALWHLLACAALKPWTDALIVQRLAALGTPHRYQPTWGGFGRSVIAAAP